MKTTSEVLFLLSAAGTLNGLILAIYLIATKRQRSIEHFFLAILLLLFSIRIGKSTFLYFNPALAKTYLQIGVSACMLIGPVLVCYIKSAASLPKKVPRTWLMALACLTTITLCGGILYPYVSFPTAWRNFVIPYIVYLTWIVSTVLSCHIFWKNRAALGQHRLLIFVLFGNCLILTSYIISYTDMLPGSYISGSIMYSLLLYLSVFLYLNYRKSKSIESYAKRKIPTEQATKLLDRLKELVVIKQLYADPDIRIGQLAQLLHIPPHQLSQLLNDNVGKSFSDYINSHRIDAAAKILIQSPHIRIEEIGYDVGFNSKSSFFSAFKKFKQVTPLKYRAASFGLRKSTVL